MGRINQTEKNLSYKPDLSAGEHARWAIQIATVDSLKWNGFDRASKFLGRNTIEHSFTRLAKIWCDKDNIPLKDPETGKHLPPIEVRGELNPGAINPHNGAFSTLHIDPHTVHDVLSHCLPDSIINLFNKATFKQNKDEYQKCKIGIFSVYCCDDPLEADHVVDTPVISSTNEGFMVSKWAAYQRRAMDTNKLGLDYNLTNLNCHTVNMLLNRENTDAVKEFANRGFMRLGANPDTIKIPDNPAPVINTLETLHEENMRLANNMKSTHQTQNNLHSVDPPSHTLTESCPS